MSEVAIIGKPDLEGKRFSFALAEDRLAHYPEFRDLNPQRFGRNITIFKLTVGE